MSRNTETFVLVYFDNEKYDYSTKVSNESTEAQLNNYFVNTTFNVGVFPQEIFRKCKSIKIVRA